MNAVDQYSFWHQISVPQGMLTQSTWSFQQQRHSSNNVFYCLFWTWHSKTITIIYLEFTRTLECIFCLVLYKRNKTLQSGSTYASEHILYIICPSTARALSIIHCRAEGKSLLFPGFFNPFKINFQCILLDILKKTSYGPIFRWTLSFN